MEVALKFWVAEVLAEQAAIVSLGRRRRLLNRMLEDAATLFRVGGAEGSEVGEEVGGGRGVHASDCITLRRGRQVSCVFFWPAWPGPPPVYPPGVFTLEIVDEDALDVSVEAEGEIDVTVEVEEP